MKTIMAAASSHNPRVSPVFVPVAPLKASRVLPKSVMVG
jgi:hypothetical protein